MDITLNFLRNSPGELKIPPQLIEFRSTAGLSTVLRFQTGFLHNCSLFRQDTLHLPRIHVEWYHRISCSLHPQNSSFHSSAVHVEQLCDETKENGRPFPVDDWKSLQIA